MFGSCVFLGCSADLANRINMAGSGDCALMGSKWYDRGDAAHEVGDEIPSHSRTEDVNVVLV